MPMIETIVSDETLTRLRMEAGTDDPAAVALVAAQMIAHSIETDDLPAGPCAR
jgi:hypothetical protein